VRIAMKAVVRIAIVSNWNSRAYGDGSRREQLQV